MAQRILTAKRGCLILFLLIFLISLIPVIYTRDRLPIGGDVFIPLQSKGIEKYLYQWNAVQNGQYFSLNYFPFYFFYEICEFFNLNIYQISSILLFSLTFIAGLGIYKLVKLFFPHKPFYFYLISIISYLFSPALLVGWVFNFVYSSSPLFIYFVFKILKFKKVMVKDIVFISLLLFFLSLDLPNPKYIFYMGVFSLVSILCALFLRIISFKFILNNLFKLILFFLLSLWLFLPLFYFVSNYSPESYVVTVKPDSITAEMADYGYTTPLKMIRLHHDNINIDSPLKEKYNSNLIIGIFSYLPIALIVLGLLIVKNRYYLILSFLCLIFLFFAVGPNKPFGFVYEILVLRIKYLAFLRTTSGAVFFLSIFYSVLLAFVLDTFARRFKALFPLLLVVILIVSYPFINGDAYRNRKYNSYSDNTQFGYQIPKDYYEIENDLDLFKRDIKILYLAEDFSYISTKWGFFGFPIYNFLYNSNNLDLKRVFSNLANHNVGFLYQDKSLLDNIGKQGEDLLADNEKNSVLVKETDLVELRKVKDEYFLPHFYVPQSLIYSSGEAGVLHDIVGFKDYEIRSGIYLAEKSSEETENTDGVQRELIERADEFYVEAKLQNQADANYLGKLDFEKNGVPFPYVRHNPGSLWYPLVLKKEKLQEWRARKDKKKLIEIKLYFSGKRISEFEKFAEDGDEILITSVVNAYQEKMEGAIEEIRRLGNYDPGEFKKQIIKLRAHLEVHKEKIGELLNYELEDWRETFNKLDDKIKDLEGKSDFKNLEYSLEIPKEEEYEIFLENREITTPISKPGKLETWIIEVGREIVSSESAQVENDAWIDLGKRVFKAGKHDLVLRLPESENLVGNDWKKKDPITVKEDEVRLHSQGFFPEAGNLFFQEIQNWQPGGLYHLSFDYKTEGGILGIGILEERKIYDEKKEEIKKEKILAKELKTSRSEDFGDWERFEAVLAADSNSLSAEIYFYNIAGLSEETTIKFRHMRIYQIIQPKIILRSKMTKPDKILATPKITFLKINATKYLVKVEGAKEPYTLVFSESYHQGWKAYLSKNQKDYEEIVASYFEKEIQEGTHRNVFLDRNSFETWGEKQIAQDRHYLVNSYANSWYITPSDVDGQKDYEIIVEFWPQQIFYISLGISLATLLGCLGYLGYDFVKKKNLNGKN
jgi:hypothetical protein